MEMELQLKMIMKINSNILLRSKIKVKDHPLNKIWLFN